MKKYFYLFILIMLYTSAIAQNSAVRDIQVLPVCWAASASVDSSLYAYWLMSSRDEVPQVVSYLNVIGQKVDVSGGGAITSGSCCCGTSGGGSTVTITDNNDGTYTAVVNSDTTIIDTIQASNTVISIPISIGDTTYLSGSNLQELLNSFSTEINQLRSRTGCDLKIGQSSHGFSVGDLLTQDPNSAAYSLASADTSINFPVAYVCEIISADSFYVDTEGWVAGAHGETVYRDYFLQDVAGTVDTTSGSFPIFAFRTFSSTLRYFDIPEYVADGSAGDGDNWGTQVVVSDATLSGNGTSGSPLSVVGGNPVSASNGLNLDTFGFYDDVRLGGTLDENTIIRGDSGTYDFLVLDADDITMEAEDSGVFYGNRISQIGQTNSNTTVLGDTVNILAVSGYINISNPDSLNVVGTSLRFGAQQRISIHTTNGGTDGAYTKSTEIAFDDNQVILRSLDAFGVEINSFVVHEDYFQLNGVQNYASDAAADADSSLPTGGVYTVTAEDRSLRIKP